ncbi:hypothetical protein WA171_002456 [Blastocystis sp. BT1]
MAKSVRSKIKRKFRAIKRQEVYVPVVNRRQDECNKRLLVNTFLNKPSGADTVAMVIEGTAPVEALESNKVVSNKSSSKPFAFIERTWEVKNPTEEEVGL